MFNCLQKSVLVAILTLAVSSTVLADGRFDRGRSFDRGSRYSHWDGGRSHSRSGFSFGFGFGNFGFRDYSYARIGFGSGYGRGYYRPTYYAPPVYRPVYYAPPPVVVYTTPSYDCGDYYYAPRSCNYDSYYSAPRSYYYGEVRYHYGR